MQGGGAFERGLSLGWRACTFTSGSQVNQPRPARPLRRECGYRILYKKRTKRIVQYEAR